METNKQQLPKNGARVDSLAKKALTRSMAIDRSDSSGGKVSSHTGVVIQTGVCGQGQRREGKQLGKSAEDGKGVEQGRVPTLDMRNML